MYNICAQNPICTFQHSITIIKDNNGIFEMYFEYYSVRFCSIASVHLPRKIDAQQRRKRSQDQSPHFFCRMILGEGYLLIFPSFSNVSFSFFVGTADNFSSTNTKGLLKALLLCTGETLSSSMSKVVRRRKLTVSHAYLKYDK